MVHLNAPDAEDNAQDFNIVYLLSQRRIETRATLFDQPEVKACYIGNRLHASFLGRRRRDGLGLGWRGIRIIQRWAGSLAIVNGPAILAPKSGF